MNEVLLKTMIDSGFVNVNKHLTADLFIYNYTSSTQYEQMWNEVTLQCRGLIMDKDFNVVARPLLKFFNLEELEDKQLPNEKFKVFDKLDGSMGLLYFIDNEPFIATRGSFKSEQSIKANQILQEKYQHTFKHLNKNLSYVFEIIYPQNRIVVDYGDKEDLVLLAILDTKTGQELPLVDIGFSLVKEYDGIEDLKTLHSLEEANKEGFVVKFDSGFRLKIKFSEYKRLHYIMANVSNKSIWLHLSEGKKLDELLHLVPDEFYNWVKKTEKGLHASYKEIEDKAKSEFKVLGDRRTTAAYFKTCTYPAIMFGMLDKKRYSDKIWRMIKPDFEKPFLNA
jgi:RNA ligase